jgi:hypothetical protein
VDPGAGVNPDPLPEKLVLGAGSALLDTSDVLVSQLTPTKPFAFEPFFMRTKYRFIEGYRGNDTVRGWRDFDSIYHSVFADLRGAGGYPKGKPWSTVPEGLLLRPAIPTEEMFDADGTYGPRANFKISLRELPDHGRFRVTVTAAKYNDGLLLDTGAKAQTGGTPLVWTAANKSVTVASPGIYQIDVYPTEPKPVAPDASRLKEGLTGAWPAGGDTTIESPVGKAVHGVTVPRSALPTDDERALGEGDFTIAAWVKPKEMGRASIASLGMANRSLGWFLELDGRAGVRFQTAGSDEGATATVSTRPGAAPPNTWSHVAVVVRRGRNETLLYVNGSVAAKASTGSARFDAEKADLQIGNLADTSKDELADVRLYRRPLEPSEIQALLEPGKGVLSARAQAAAGAPGSRRRQGAADLTLRLGDREFSGSLQQPAFLAVRLPAGPLPIRAKYDDVKELDRIVLTPLTVDDSLAKRFLTFEKRLPRLGVHLGLRRDCGSTLAPVGPPQTVAGDHKLAKYVFEGDIDNFPAPIVEKDNVNYLAGIHEIGVRSEYTDGRDMPRLLIRSVEFEGPYLESWPPPSHKNIFVSDSAPQIIRNFATKAFRHPITPRKKHR